MSAKNQAVKNHPTIERSTVWIMATACGMTVANLYYNQPLLGEFSRTFHVSPGQVGFIPTLTQIGYGTGMLLFVPLGDMSERRRLIVTMLGIAPLALVAAAVSPNITCLAVASLAIGLTSVATQIIIPLAAQLAAPHEQGKVVGNITSGVLIGVLLARTVSGYIGESLGWRGMFWLAAFLMMILAVVLAKSLPRSQPSFAISYSQLLRSLPKLIYEQPVLREAALVQAMLFGAFSAFWTTLVFLLEAPPYNYGSGVAGLFGLVGLVGAVAAPVIGRFADKKSPRLAVRLAIAIQMSAFLIFGLFGHQLWGLIVGVILLDLGMQGAYISNQVRIFNLLPDARSRLNTVFMVTGYLGGAFGSSLGAQSWSLWQWNGVCLLGLLMIVVALAVHFGKRRSHI